MTAVLNKMKKKGKVTPPHVLEAKAKKVQALKDKITWMAKMKEMRETSEDECGTCNYYTRTLTFHGVKTSKKRILGATFAGFRYFKLDGKWTDLASGFRLCAKEHKQKGLPCLTKFFDMVLSSYYDDLNERNLAEQRYTEWVKRNKY